MKGLTTSLMPVNIYYWNCH